MPAIPPLNPKKPMDGLTRRTLLTASCGLAAVGVVAAGAKVTWDDVLHRAASTPLASGTPILVVLTMYGGNDGLNTVIPYADRAYHDARPELAYSPDDVLHLDDTLGLNPGLKGLSQLWQDQQLAVVRGVGYPQPDHSHFRSMDIWQTASPQTPVSTGWVGRWLDTAGDDPLLALNMGDVLPPLAVGSHATAAALSPGAAAPRSADDAILRHLATLDPHDTEAAKQVVASYAAVQRVRSTLAGATDGSSGSSDPSGSASTPTGTATPDATTSAAPATKTGGSSDSLADQLDLVARCIKIGSPTRVYAVSLSGFDTHADEKISQTIQLTQVDKALTAFRASLSGHPREGDVVTVAYTEFGRRVKANASEGTDHGTAGPMFVMGPRVKGGFYGDQPSLTDLDDGDLKTTTDFRAVYGELLSGALGADPTRVLDQTPTALGFLA